MDFNYFWEFIVLTEEKNYAEAAARLDISEPTLSRHIRALEDELGVRLFDRTSRSVKINKYGQIFLEYANQHIDIQQHCQNDINSVKELVHSTVNVGFCYFIDDLLTHFTLYDNTISINPINIWNSDNEIIEALRHGKCDVAFVNSLDVITDEFEVSLFETDKYVAVLPKSHPLADRDCVDLKELKRENFISFSTGSYGDIHLKNICHQAGFNPKIVLTAHIGSAISSFIKEGAGISILRQKSIMKVHPSGVSLVDISPECPLNVYFCYMKQAKLSSATKKLITYTTEIWPELKPKAFILL